MKNSFLLFALKCSIICYFAACTNTEDFVVSKTVASVVKSGDWKVNLYLASSNDQTNDFAGYKFTFSEGGILKVNKTGNPEIMGSWFEDEINKVLLINLGNADPVLAKLNESWNISILNETVVGLESNTAHGSEKLNISNQ